MSKKILDQLVETISPKISYNCSIQRLLLRELIQQMFNQKTHFKNFEYLSNNAFSLDLKAMNIQQNCQVCLRFIKYSNQDGKNSIESLQKDYEKLQMLSPSDFLVNVYDLFYLMEENEAQEESQKEISTQTDVKSFFVVEMELCQNNLKDLFNFFRIEQLASTNIKEILAIQMLDGLNSLHLKNITHKDIRPQNFQISPCKNIGFTIKLCGLGFSQVVAKSKRFQLKRVNDTYSAPETENGSPRIQSDLFSMGLILLELDNLKTLEEDWIDSNTREYLVKGKEIPQEKYQLNKKSNIYKIAQICLRPNYLDRTSAGDLLSDIIKMHSKPLELTLTSMILEDKIQIQAQQLVDRFNQQQKLSQIDEFEQFVLGNTYFKIKNRNLSQQFTNVEISSNLLKSLYEDKKYSNNFKILSFGSEGILLSTKKIESNNEEIVLKIQKVENEENIQNEISIMQKLKEPFVVQLYDSYYIEKATVPDRYVVFELEKCSCSLEDYINRLNKDGLLNEDSKLNIAIEIIKCVNYIHSFNIIHRDIKIDNFQVCLEGDQTEIKLCNFGYSVQLGDDQDSIQILEVILLKCIQTLIQYIISIQPIGNVGYMAPEILTKKENENKIYSKKSDSYSVGLVLALIDNYQELKEQPSLSFLKMTLSQSQTSFQNQKIQINENTETYQFIKPLIESDFNNRTTISELVELNKKYFSSDFDDMENELNDLDNQNNQEETLKNQNIEINNIKDLSKIAGFQVIHINLKSNQIGTLGAKNLGAGIAEYKNITNLSIDLYWNKIGDQGIQDLVVKGISQCKNITNLKLDLYLNQITSLGAKFLGTGISQCKEITHLTLDLGLNQIGEQGASDLGSGIAECKNITNLVIDLRENQIGDSGIKGLGTGISQLKNITNLALNLYLNQIGEQGAKEFGTGIAQCQNIRSLTLDFRENMILAQGTNDLGKGISQCKLITNLILDLRWNQIGDLGAKKLGKCLAQCKNITNLKLDLYSNAITSQGAIDLGLGIAQSSNITHLAIDLRSNQIDSLGARGLGKGISECKNIIDLNLNLYSNQIGAQGAKDLATEIGQCKNITNLTLELKQILTRRNKRYFYLFSKRIKYSSSIFKKKLISIFFNLFFQFKAQTRQVIKEQKIQAKKQHNVKISQVQCFIQVKIILENLAQKIQVKEQLNAKRLQL